jgi:hypothetical protein
MLAKLAMLTSSSMDTNWGIKGGEGKVNSIL